MATNDEIALAEISQNMAAMANDVAVVTQRLQSLLPTFVQTKQAIIPITSPTTITCQPMSNQLVRVRGILACYPVTSLGLARVTVGSLIIDLPITTSGVAMVIDDPTVTHFVRQTDTISFQVGGVISSSTGKYATLWVWGEQVPTTGMMT